MTIKEEIEQDEIAMIEKAIMFLDIRYKEVFFDVTVEKISGLNLYTIFVSDLDFYLKDEKFKKDCKMLKRKFSVLEGSLWFIFAYQRKIFENG